MRVSGKHARDAQRVGIQVEHAPHALGELDEPASGRQFRAQNEVRAALGRRDLDPSRLAAPDDRPPVAFAIDDFYAGGRARAKEFSWEKTVTRTLSLLERVK